MTIGRNQRAGFAPAARQVRVRGYHAAMMALCLGGVSETALAQSASPGAAITLAPITVEAPRRVTAAPAPPRRARTASTRSATAPAEPRVAAPAPSPSEIVQQRFAALAGGATQLTARDIPDSGNLTLSKALSLAPGVVVQSFFGGNDQPRIQIRGSGLQQNPVERGVLMLQNGIPLNRADGSYIVGFADPRQAETIEIYRGYLANRLGATVNGGAINFVSPTGSSQPGAQMTVSAGSFGQINTNVQAGFNKGDVDGLISADVTRRSGYRDYNMSERESFNANIGVRHSENVSTRFFAGYTSLDFDVAGPLTKDALYQNPRQVHRGPTVVGGVAINPGPNVVRDRPHRDASQFLVGARTTATFDAHLIDFGLAYTYTDDTFRFPISSGVRKTEGGDLTALARYAYNPAAALLPLFETTVQATTGSAAREYDINQNGMTGAKFGENKLSATTVALYSGFNVPLAQAFTVSPAISYAFAERRNEDTYNLPTRPTIGYNPANPTVLLPNGAVPTQNNSYSRRYDGFSPSLAFTYRPDALQTLFVAASRSFEPPTHDDLLATVNGTPNTSPGRPNPAQPFAAAAAFTAPDLKAQTATTIEGGWRGRADRLSWDAVVYHSWLENELLSLRDSTGAPIGAINAGRTTHFGIELGGGLRLTDRLSGRLAYVYQDLRFDNDPIRGNNRLAGAPPHLVTGVLQFQATEDWRLQGTVRWVAEKTYVDNMNTLFADPYTVVDLRTDYRINKTLSVFGEVTNLFNKTYASSTLIVDTTRPDQAAFLPGDGRGFYAGMRARF